MTDEEKRIYTQLIETVLSLPMDQQQYILGYAEGLRDAKGVGV